MNSESVRAWFRDESKRDIERNRQEIPLQIFYGPPPLEEPSQTKRHGKDYYEIILPEREKHGEEWWQTFSKQTIALIAHDAMKNKLVDFAIQYEHELVLFDKILATGATAQEIKSACKNLSDKVKSCLPGPRGEDIEIATAVLFNKCHIVIFFIDPLHPHIEDIRVVFSVCMAEIKNNDVRMLTNEVQAREWAEQSVRRYSR